MALVYLGTDFHDSPLTDLELLEAASERVLVALSARDSILDGVVVVATCNRFEIYFEAESFHDSVAFVTRMVAEQLGTEHAGTGAMLTPLYGDSVSAHLFSVAAGLESMIVGEEEISGQVKRALIAAHNRGSVSKNLHRLFQSAASVAKSVATSTGLGITGRSVITTALDLADERLRGLAGRDVLIIGTGAYSRVVTAAARRLNVGQIFVYSRSGRAAKFSATHETTPVSAEDLVAVMASVDLVVSASGTAGHVVSAEIASLVAARRGDRDALVLIDVSLSRDVAHDVSEVAGMFVIDLETLKSSPPQEHVESISAARNIVRSAAIEFEESMAARTIDPAITALRAHIGLRVEQEIESVRRKSGDAAAQEVQRSLRRVANGLLHVPSLRARELAVLGNHSAYADAVRLIFDIEVGGHG